MKPREVIARIEAEGWFEVRQTGGHRHFRHPEKSGLVTIPMHPGDIDQRVIRSIEKQSGVSLK